MDKVTKEQAAVISAYTGFLLGQFSDMHEYVEKVIGRPVWTHEMGSEAFMAKLHEASRPDFLALDPNPQ